MPYTSVMRLTGSSTRRTPRWLAVLAYGIVGLTAPHRYARADVAPPPPPEKCTLAQVAQPTLDCVVCGDSSAKAKTLCQQKYQPDGFAKKCQTSGEVVWNEIWCKPAADTEPTGGKQAASVRKAGSCGACNMKPSQWAWSPFVMLLAALWCCSRRRS